ncbi:hypothetical protein K432DRAFT_426820 [Lepidopterella palustris CBS 459.81]|uniref:Uncharacterized protein n=1 Tax=Lepidopterella palustris CBS 459.81 TaxID=1314670 RepID=A0A8E2E870_9PEZI|nr:hypothetical protein K432DRAFT_426820 [Lepidopterella palustris CBS 459.81]
MSRAAGNAETATGLTARSSTSTRTTSSCSSSRNASALPNLTPTGQRMLLYSRQQQEPYSSAYAHWRGGEFMNLCKCTTSRIPERKRGFGKQALKDGKGVTGINYAQRKSRLYRPRLWQL